MLHRTTAYADSHNTVNSRITKPLILGQKLIMRDRRTTDALNRLREDETLIANPRAIFFRWLWKKLFCPRPGEATQQQNATMARTGERRRHGAAHHFDAVHPEFRLLWSSARLTWACHMIATACHAAGTESGNT